VATGHHPLVVARTAGIAQTYDHQTRSDIQALLADLRKAADKREHEGRRNTAKRLQEALAG
jgi:hypothetical protein